MYKLLLVGMEGDNFAALVNALQAHGGVQLSQVASGDGALAGLKNQPADLVVAAEQLADMSGLVFAQKLVVQNPMVNCALASALDEADFHEATEGLGLLAHLPLEPDAAQAENLIKKLDLVTGQT